MTDELLDTGLDAGAPEPSLRDELASALEADTAAQAAAPAAEPIPQISAAEQAARDERGRFAPKPEPKTPQASAEPSAAPGQQAPAQPRTIAPPPSWSAAAKADFEKLPPHIREEVAKREADIERGKAQWDQKAERFNRLDAILAPRRERYRMAGIEESEAVNQLLAAQDYLERDPVNAIAYLARSFGVDLRMYAGQAGQQQPQQAQLPPQIQAMAQDVQSLKQALAQQSASAEQATRSGYLDQVQQFAANPSNLYFENVREKMGALIRAGTAKDLQDAYDQAVWADPEIRPLLLRQQEGARAAEARAKASQARYASGSVTGSPAPGATPGRGGPAPSLRDELTAAFAQHAA